MLKHKVSFSIAGLDFGLESDRPEPVEWLRTRYAFYLSEAGPRVKISLYYGRDKPPSHGKKLLSGPYTIYEEENKGCEFKIYAKGGYAALGDMLRFLSSRILLKSGGFLLHSCAVVIGSGAYIFAGPSGAGKTTIAGLFTGHKDGVLLSDETTAVTRNGSGYYGWATPFFGDFGGAGANNKAVLKAVFFLRQSRRFGLKKLGPARSASGLLQNIFLIGRNWRYNLDGLCDAALECGRKVAAYELEFLPNKRIWNYIEEKLSPGA